MRGPKKEMTKNLVHKSCVVCFVFWSYTLPYLLKNCDIQIESVHWTQELDQWMNGSFLTLDLILNNGLNGVCFLDKAFK